MKWIKRNVWIVAVTIIAVHLLFSQLIKAGIAVEYYHTFMDTVFIHLFKYNIENVNFVQIIFVLGIHYCAFYYMIALMLDFSKGVKALIQYTSANLSNFNLKILRLMTKEYLKRFFIFVVITIGLYMIMTKKMLHLVDVQFILIWIICDIIVLYFIQRVNHIESVTLLFFTLYILARKYIFNMWYLMLILLCIHCLIDKYRKEN